MIIAELRRETTCNQLGLSAFYFRVRFIFISDSVLNEAFPIKRNLGGKKSKEGIVAGWHLRRHSIQHQKGKYDTKKLATVFPKLKKGRFLKINI